MGVNKKTGGKSNRKPTIPSLLKMNREQLEESLTSLPFASLSDLLGQARTNIEQNDYLLTMLKQSIKAEYPEYSTSDSKIKEASNVPRSNGGNVPNRGASPQEDLVVSLYDNSDNPIVEDGGSSYISPPAITLDIPNS